MQENNLPSFYFTLNHFFMLTESSRLQKILNVWRLAQKQLRRIRKNPDSRLMRIARIVLRIGFVGYLVFCAVFLSLRYVVFPQISQFKPNIEKELSEGLGRLVTISRVDASWYGFHPLLKLDKLVIHDPEGNPALHLPEVKAEVSWWSFFVFDLRLAHLEIIRPELDIRRDSSGALFVAGLPADTRARKKGKGMDWILMQDMITIRDGTVRWLDGMRRAPELVLKNLNFILANEGRRHRARFIAQPDMAKSGEIDIRVDFVHPLFAERISDTTGWKGDVYVALPTTELDPWEPYIDFPNALKKGAGSVNVWMTFDHARIADLTVDVDLNNVMLQFEPDLPVLNLVHLSGRISGKELFDDKVANDRLSLGNRPHAVALSDISLETADGIRMGSVDFSEKHIPASDGNPASTEIITDELDLGTMIRLAEYLPLAAGQRKMLDDFSPSGELNGFAIQWQGQYPDLVSYQLKGKFKNLSMNAAPARPARAATATTPAQAAIPAIPGFRNLTGSISASEKGGSLELDADAATLNLPSYFPKSDWHFDELRLLANWSIASQDQFVFVIEKMAFSLDGISATLSGQHIKPLNEEGENTPGMIDMTATVESVDMTKARNYVPLQTKDALRTWLSKAFEEGTASNITVHLKGDLVDFPFSGKATTPDSEFSVRMNVSDVRLNYAPTLVTREGRLMWQPIEKINGWLTIKGGEIVIHADNAVLSGVVLSDVNVTIPDMLAEDASLNITGKANGELQNFIRFVNTSPVNDVIGGLTEESKTTGNTSLLLKMQMPLSNMANSKVEGALQFADNDIILFPDLPVLTTVQGKVHFSDKGFDLEGISAQFLGGNVNISGGTRDGRSQVSASGTLTADGLRRNYPSGAMGKLMGRLSGSMPYTLSIVQRGGSQGGGYPDIVVESGMNGLGIDLPAPLGKKSTETRQLRVTANPVASTKKVRRDEIRIAYGSGAAAHYERQKVDGVWQLVRGGLGINMKPVLHPGVSLNLKMPSLDFNIWQESLASLFADGDKNKGIGKGGADIGKYVEPQQFHIQVDELTAMEFRLSRAAITGIRQPGRWQADVDSGEMKGRLIWTEPSRKQTAGKLTGRFTSLAIPRTSPEKIEDVVKRDQVHEMPAIDLTVDNFTLFDIRLGHLELVASNQRGEKGREWQINRLSVSNPDGRLQSSGNWVIEKSGAQRTRMNYDLDIHNAGRLLGRLGYKGILSDGKGKMHGDISWFGLPYSLDIQSLSGKMELNVGKGQFLKVEPGIAKLLGVLSMQSLPRRLTLDFRDVFSDGFAFDEITARTDIANGVAKTENLTMKGVQATVLMNGSVDIANETQNLHVAVLPEINAGAASIVYSLINPAVGVGTFLAQLFLKEPLSRAFTYEYQITGSWAEPNIQKVERKNSRTGKSSDTANPVSQDEI